MHFEMVTIEGLTPLSVEDSMELVGGEGWIDALEYLNPYVIGKEVGAAAVRLYRHYN